MAVSCTFDTSIKDFLLAANKGRTSFDLCIRYAIHDDIQGTFPENPEVELDIEKAFEFFQDCAGGRVCFERVEVTDESEFAIRAGAIGQNVNPLNMDILIQNGLSIDEGGSFGSVGDIVVKPGVTWDRGDFNYVIAHHVGHILGLDHSGNDPEVLFTDFEFGSGKEVTCSPEMSDKLSDGYPTVLNPIPVPDHDHPEYAPVDHDHPHEHDCCHSKPDNNWIYRLCDYVIILFLVFGMILLTHGCLAHDHPPANEDHVHPEQVGPQGEAGAMGPQGLIGNTGPEGPQGITGSDGPRGIEGVPGPPGEGIPGPAGPQGPQGATGASGSDGADGSPGEAGATGPQGSQGDRGPQGLTGPQGEQGPKGDKGSAGDGTPGTCSQIEIRWKKHNGLSCLQYRVDGDNWINVPTVE